MKIDITKPWYSLSGKKILNIIDKIKSDIKEYTSKLDYNQCKIMIGTDSQRHGNNVTYVTAIVVINVGRAYYIKYVESIPGITECISTINRKEIIKNYIISRLWNETMLSVDYAIYINEQLDDCKIKIRDIHCDINPNKKFKSSDVLKATNGYIQGLGFNSIIKPYGWVASCISNSKTK